jgi:hypothetical protein
MIRLVSIAMLAGASAFAFGCSDSSSCRLPCGASTTDGNGGSSTVDTGKGGGGVVRPADVVCKASFAGNYTATAVKEGKCATVSKMGDAWVLTIHVSEPKSGVGTDMNFTLGKSPSPGKLGPESNLQSWTVIGVRQVPCTATGTANGCLPPQTCEYSAANDAVPSGTFSLELTEVDLTDAKPVVHGVVEATQTVQASAAGADCGTDDYETLAVVF